MAASAGGEGFSHHSCPCPPPCTGRKPAPSCLHRKEEACDTQHSPGSPVLRVQPPCHRNSQHCQGEQQSRIFPVGPHKLLQDAVLGQDLILSRHIYEPARSRTQLLVPRQTSWVLLLPKQVPETQVKSVHPAIPLGYGASPKWWLGAEKGSLHLPPQESHSSAQETNQSLAAWGATLKPPSGPQTQTCSAHQNI